MPKKSGKIKYSKESLTPLQRKTVSRERDISWRRREARVFKHDFSFLTMCALCFMFIFIVWGIDDPIEIFDRFVDIVMGYSKAVVWVKEFWDVFCGDNFGLIGWLIEKIFKVEVTFGWSDVFSYIFSGLFSGKFPGGS